MRLNHTIWCIWHKAWLCIYQLLPKNNNKVHAYTLNSITPIHPSPFTQSYYGKLNTLAIVYYKDLYEPSLAVDDSFNLAQINFYSILDQKSKLQVFITSRGMFVYHLSRTRISSLISGINLSWNQWKSPVGLGHANHLSFHPALLNCI